jgi:hypothetical protein
MDMWNSHEPQFYFDKTRLCYRLLICWYIADIYPEFSRGIMTSMGLPLSQKKIGPITIGYNVKHLTGQDPLQMLLSNAFGVKAHGMIKNAVVRMRYRGIPPRLLGSETEMGWFLRLIATGASGRILGPNTGQGEQDVR